MPSETYGELSVGVVVQLALQFPEVTSIIVSVPCGFADGLPVGLSLIGRRFRDADALSVAALFQSFTDWHEWRPRPGEEAAAV